MGMFDNLKGKADQAKAKAAELADQHGDKITSGMDKAGSFVDQKTGGKHTDQIERAKRQAKHGLDSLDGHRDEAADPAPPTVTPPTPTPPAATPPAATPPAATPPAATPAPVAPHTATAPTATPPTATPPTAG